MEERLHEGETKGDVQETAAGADSPRSIAPDSKYSKERHRQNPHVLQNRSSVRREQERLPQPRAQTQSQQSSRSDTAAAGSFGPARQKPNLGSWRCRQVCHSGWGAAPNRNGAACSDLGPY